MNTSPLEVALEFGLEVDLTNHPAHVHPARPPHPPKTPRVQWVMDELGERVVVLFPCERCGDAQHYSVLHKASSCFRCDGVAPGRNDSTAG